jgi:predicted nucleotidyltransferase
MREILGEELLAVYTGGSYALGAYEHGRSDIDVTVVVASPLDTATKDARTSGS